MSEFLVTLDHVQVAAPPACEAAAREFYGGLLGMQELDKPDTLRGRGGCWFAIAAAGAQQLHIGVEEDFRPARKAHPAFRIARFDELRQRLTDHGCPVIDDNEIAGVRRFFSYDPWGNRLEFVEHAAPGASLR